MKLQKEKIPAISIITLTFDREQYLRRAVESVLGQNFTDFELILVDNGSVNRCGVICDEYAAKDSRISVIHKPKGNIGSGRNAGLRAAKGEFIVFIDDDDIAEADMLDFLHKLIIRYQADISICGSWYSINGEKVPKYVDDRLLVLNTKEAIIELLNRKYFNSSSAAKMFRRSIIPADPYSEEGFIDDINTVYKIFTEAKRVAVQGKPRYTFFRHDGNLTAFTLNFRLLTPEILNEYIIAFSERTAYLSERFPVIKEFIEYKEWSFMLSMSEKVLHYNLKDCYAQVSYMQKRLIGNHEAGIAL